MNLNALTTQIDREHDSCGIFARIEKTGMPTRTPVVAGLEALNALSHRAGYVQGEGDGCGLLLDIPRALWRRWLIERGLTQKGADVVDDERFFVAHLLLNRAKSGQLLDEVITDLKSAGFNLLLTRVDVSNQEALGPLGSQENPVFVQIAGLTPESDDVAVIDLITALERHNGLHVASMSRSTCVYKVVGDGETLANFYPDLRDADCTSAFVLAHTRYSTNTTTSFFRVQPFGLLGHNGEINTIARFYEESGMAGIPLDAAFSDSQMVDRSLHYFVAKKGWSLFEAAETLFPPIVNEVKQMRSDLADMYMFLRSLWGPFAQGPAAVMMRFGSQAVFGVDALGLRPMWLVETADGYTFSSEQGIVPTSQWVADPKPLSPGEKMGVEFTANGVILYPYTKLQRHVFARMMTRYQFGHEAAHGLRFAGSLHERGEVAHPYRGRKSVAIRQAAFGWREDDVKAIDFELQTGVEPIRSLGNDSPIAALDTGLRSIPDFVHETVAVVTNPAIDREREVEHFSTRTVLGKRPSLDGLYQDAPRVEIQSPLLLEELSPASDVTLEDIEAIANRRETLCYEDALAALHTGPYGTVEILLHRHEGESVSAALARFSQEALEAVQAGANVIALDDRLSFARGAYIDAFLAVAAVHKALLRPSSSQGGEHLRRRTSIVLRSGAMRNLHDIVTAIGLGAEAVDPYLMWEHAAQKGSVAGVENLHAALCKGLEKVISTLGIHELRGYERLFGAIGLHEEVSQWLGVPTFCGGKAGFGFAAMEAEAALRQALYDVDDEKQLRRAKNFQLYPRIWKAAGLVAMGEAEYETFYDRLATFERENPISIRHVLGFKGIDDAAVASATGGEAVDVSAEAAGSGADTKAGGDAKVSVDSTEVDTTIDGHSYPLVISSMSFGSQSETAYRAYAEAGYRTNIVALNGEGGEIKDLLTRYPRHRGRQIASGRFGVNADLCNGAYVLEIKIGQGAKPGEGGHLPGSKVTEQVAAARNASLGTDLISPSNNHDIYSIEDLAQVVHELHEINPHAKVAVKVPVVPNIGTIAVGVVKAGADVVTLSGFDGGTGAARAHAIRHVGLPVEIGVKLAHEALCAAGLRDSAEIWADGGMKSGADVMKAILLGANRVGFGTMAMVAIGCTSCRACHKDTCHVGIATQMTSLEEAKEKGLPKFEPREFEQAVGYLQRLFTAIGEHVARLTAALGATRTQDLVGKSDLLTQLSMHDALDVNWLIKRNLRHDGLGVNVQTRHGNTLAAEEAEVLAMAAGTETAVAGVTMGGDSVPEAMVSRTGKGVLWKVLTGSGRAEVDGGSDSGAASAETAGIVGLPRAQGTRQAGQKVRLGADDVRISNETSNVGGNGFAAYHTEGMVSVAHGGGQDGVGKAAFGGKIVILKQQGPDGVWRGGSVGKGLAYGAQRGTFFIQGDADARAGIRLSGADIVIGGEPRPVRDELGWVGERANLKGFAFEYMTAGRAVVLGDPGPWICSGMTGGSVYVRMSEQIGLTEDVLRRRLAKGAKVVLRYLDEDGERDVEELLTNYQRELRHSGQWEAANALQPMIDAPVDHFMMVRPGAEITDQTIATE
ncbi:glutamate synthase-related protein [Alicyclobacillus sp. ALC3]|uniref:glutamate synthase-related protein n=1 Tax=Alicyclobacillus sp. ALC3 TaxID=2796143 RepID=UPI0023785E90|nr:glutamate synthase-related protein [Alicyclobacillus sp. ALC3]